MCHVQSSVTLQVGYHPPFHAFLFLETLTAKSMVHNCHHSQLPLISTIDSFNLQKRSKPSCKSSDLAADCTGALWQRGRKNPLHYWSLGSYIHPLTITLPMAKLHFSTNLCRIYLIAKISKYPVLETEISANGDWVTILPSLEPLLETFTTIPIIHTSYHFCPWPNSIQLL